MEKKKSLLKRVREMEVGESISVSWDEYEYGTIRGYTSNLSIMLEREYSSRRDKENRTHIITRLA